MSKWKMVRLGDVCEIVAGSTPSTSKQEYWDGSFYWVTPAEISDGDYYIERTQRKLTEAGISSAGLRLMPVGTVLLSSRAPIGKVAITAVEMACNQGFKNFVCGEKIHNRFLYYFLKNNKHYLNSLGRGATFKEISKSIVCEVEIPLPPLEEQKHIADILDKASNLIGLRKQQLEKMDLLIKSKFIDMFGNPVTNPKGWEVKKLKDICTKLTDGTHFSPENLEKGQYKYVTAKNIKENGFDFTNISYVNEKVHREIFSRCNPEYGDILYIKDGVTAGIAQINTLNEEFSLLSSVALLKQNRKIVNKYYFREALNNNHMYDRIRENMGGAAITRLTIAKINVLRIPVPPTELQNQFAEFVEKVEKQKAVMQQSLEKMEMNYKALMQEYF